MTGSKHQLAAYFIASALCLAGQAFWPHASDRLQGPLQLYEAAVQNMLEKGNPEERGAAVNALAQLASPRYEAARDKLANDPAPSVRMGLLAAMATMGDSSEEALKILAACLASDDEKVVARASSVEGQNLQIPIPFEQIWTPSAPTLLWLKWGQVGWNSIDKVTGVGKARPWNDPAWKGLSEDVKLALLCRAGTREAFPLALEALGRKVPPAWGALRLMEPVDKPFLRELVQDPRPDVRRAASHALIQAGDGPHLEYITHVVEEFCRGIDEIPQSTLDDLAVGEALPRLGVSWIRTLMVRSSADKFWTYASELEKEGSPLTYAEAMGRTHTLEPAYLSGIQNLRYFQLKALVRERIYVDLPDHLTIALMSTNPSAELGSLNSALLSDREFLSGLPPDVAHDCLEKIDAWIRKTRPEKFSVTWDRSGVADAFRTIGILARGPDEAAIWRKWRESKDPFGNGEALLPVVWGTTQRGEELRGMLATVRDQGWYRSILQPLVYDVIKDQWPEKEPEDYCRPGRERLPSFVDSLPQQPPSLGALKSALIRALDENGALDSRRAAANDFLALRGMPARPDDAIGVLRVLGDRRLPIRREAFTMAGGRLTQGTHYSPSFNACQVQPWMDANGARLASLASEPSLPGPPLSTEERGWIESRFLQEQRAHFDRLVDGIVNPSGIGAISCGVGPEATKSYMTPPSTSLLDAGMEYTRQTKELLKSNQVAVRHAAAWALWQMLHDPAALQVYLDDAKGTDPKAKASALYVLQQLRYAPGAPSYPPLLTNPDRALRQAGLYGIRTFHLASSIPEVENLVTDLDETVAATAVDVLGVLHPAEARPLLMALISKEGPLNFKAAQALRYYRDTSDVDAFVRRLGDPAADDAEKWNLLGILRDVTGRGGLQIWSYYRGSEPQVVKPETIRDWQAWWRENATKSPAERTRQTIVNLVAAYLGETDDSKLTERAWALSRYFETDYTSTPEFLKKSRERFAIDWEPYSKASAWDMLTGPPQAKPVENINLLMSLDSNRAYRLLYAQFASLYRGDPMPSNRWRMAGSSHVWLAYYSGVDFGDLDKAQCGTKAAIFGDWEAWAKREGWAQ